MLKAGLLALPIAWFAAWFGLGRRRGLGALLTRGVPSITPEALGVFRVFYAACLFAMLSRSRLHIDEDYLRPDGAFAWRWVAWLIGQPELITWLERGILTFLVLFAVGLFTRGSYALVVAGMAVWMVVMLQPPTNNAHVWEVGFLMMVCLLPVAWGTAFSVDAALRRWRGTERGAPQPGTRLGFAVWLPGFLLGAVWASAAYSKVAESGASWILGGAVKYHWVIDAHGAPVDWGLWVASHHWAAVLMSFMGVALEASFIVAAFAAAPRTRAILAAAIGLPLLLGFYLFHGVIWWPWWLALVSFAFPWQAAVDLGARRWRSWAAPNRSKADDSGAAEGPVRQQGLQPVHAVIVGLVCAMMLAELPEGFGRFTSYSNTYASTADFDERQPIDDAEELWIRYGTPSARRVFEGAAAADALAQAIARLGDDRPLPPHAAAPIAELSDTLARTTGDGGGCITLVRRARRFDWETGRFVAGDDEVIGSGALRSRALWECHPGDPATEP
jgi:hypothetical protein